MGKYWLVRPEMKIRIRKAKDVTKMGKHIKRLSCR